jgi:hypothetical protein
MSMVVDEMIEREHEVALAILSLKLDPASYAPQLKPAEKTEDHETTVKAAEKGGEERGKFVDFSEWKTFPTTLEFDHQGRSIPLFGCTREGSRDRLIPVFNSCNLKEKY